MYMNPFFNYLGVAMVFLLLSCTSNSKMRKLNYPVTKTVDVKDDYFGTYVSDPYRWLEDDNSSETKEWVVSQNHITDSLLACIPFRAKVKERLTKLWNYPKMGVPVNHSGMLVYAKNDGLQNQSVYFYKQGEQGEEKLLLDPNTLSEDGTVALNSFEISHDGKYLGYLISRSGSDWQEIFVKEIESGRILDDHISWVKFSGIAWLDEGFFYTRYDEPKKGDELKGENINPKVCYHKVGDDMSNDLLVYEDKEHPERNIDAELTKDKKYLVIYQTESTSGNALYIKDLQSKNTEIVKVVTDFESDHSLLDHDNGEFILKTNYKAPKERIVKFTLNNYRQDDWQDVIPENEDAISSVSLVGHNLIVSYLHNAHEIAKVFDQKGAYKFDIELPSIGSINGFGGEKEDDVTYFSFTSFVYPSTIYKYTIANNKVELFWKPNVDIDFDQYVTKQVFYTSKDGTQVPMFIVHKKDILLDGTNPSMLYGYGGFNISLTPNFSVSRMILLENNGVFAMANLRGGGEFGKQWHEAGTKFYKQNVFDDCIAAAEFLIDKGYTSNKKLALHGGSNGGLLVGAVINQRPDLFKVSLPAVGVMDMLRYHKFTIGRFWATDYGISEDSKEMFEYLYSYSPVHNIKEGVEYPATMVLTADHDDRVVPAHSFKFISELQAKYKGENPVVIRIESKAGHGAGKPTEKIVEEAADLYSFMFYNMGESIDY